LWENAALGILSVSDFHGHRPNNGKLPIHYEHME